MQSETISFTIQDIDYLRHGDRAFKMRLFKPDVPGRHPAVIDVHGGAWNRGDLTTCAGRDEALAAAGLVVAAIDFRHAEDGYPTSLADINYAIRWLKAHASEHGVDPARIGITGQSSGGHLAMLAAMRPEDPRYAAIPLEGKGGDGVDATVRCVGMAWPVINPASRYRHALRVQARTEPPGWVDGIPECHDIYWGTMEAMEEGNPTLMLERGEAVLTPPALWVQGRPDEVHDYLDTDSGATVNEPERFVENYRKAGGEIDLVVIEQETRDSDTSYQPLAKFFLKHLR